MHALTYIDQWNSHQIFDTHLYEYVLRRSMMQIYGIEQQWWMDLGRSHHHVMGMDLSYCMCAYAPPPRIMRFKSKIMLNDIDLLLLATTIYYLHIATAIYISNPAAVSSKQVSRLLHTFHHEQHDEVMKKKERHPQVLLLSSRCIYCWTTNFPLCGEYHLWHVRRWFKCTSRLSNHWFRTCLLECFPKMNLDSIHSDDNKLRPVEKRQGTSVSVKERAFQSDRSAHSGKRFSFKREHLFLDKSFDKTRLLVVHIVSNVPVRMNEWAHCIYTNERLLFQQVHNILQAIWFTHWLFVRLPPLSRWNATFESWWNESWCIQFRTACMFDFASIRDWMLATPN